jgi:hypothetical protein
MSTIPDKYIRQAYITAINAELSANYVTCAIFETEVPKDVIPIPATRMILSTQTKKQANTTKCGHDWNCTILVDIISEQNQGFSDKSITEDLEELVNNAIDISPSDLLIPPFIVYNTQVLSSNDMGLETPTKTINRKVVRFQHILGLPG